MSYMMTDAGYVKYDGIYEDSSGYVQGLLTMGAPSATPSGEDEKRSVNRS
jgi:hypothetical protein